MFCHRTDKVGNTVSKAMEWRSLLLHILLTFFTYIWSKLPIFSFKFGKEFQVFSTSFCRKTKEKRHCVNFSRKKPFQFSFFLFKLLLLICSQLLYLLKIHVRLGFFPLIWPVPVWRIDRKLGNLVEKCIWNIQF